MSIIWNTEPQGSEGWLEARRGCITASRFKDARDRLKNGSWGSKALGYAYDIARERVGGTPPQQGQNQFMRIGTEQEPVARMQYELRTGFLCDEVGFAHTHDRKFGGSADSLIDDDGIWECKTLVSSKTLFDALVDGDISEYRDQCLGALWLLHRKWVDLTLWCPDLNLLHIVRIERDEDAIQALVDDLVKFEQLVSQCEARLRALLAELPDAPDVTLAPAPAAAAPIAAPAPAVITVKPGEVADLPF
jgi:exodeoxyribonuclease (lambda-induced)